MESQSRIDLPVRPRQYAAEILRLPAVERDAAVQGRVPAELREWVRHYIEDRRAKDRARLAAGARRM